MSSVYYPTILKSTKGQNQQELLVKSRRWRDQNNQISMPNQSQHLPPLQATNLELRIQRDDPQDTLQQSGDTGVVDDDVEGGHLSESPHENSIETNGGWLRMANNKGSSNAHTTTSAAERGSIAEDGCAGGETGNMHTAMIGAEDLQTEQQCALLEPEDDDSNTVAHANNDLAIDSTWLPLKEISANLIPRQHGRPLLSRLLPPKSVSDTRVSRPAYFGSSPDRQSRSISIERGRKDCYIEKLDEQISVVGFSPPPQFEADQNCDTESDSGWISVISSSPPPQFEADQDCVTESDSSVVASPELLPNDLSISNWNDNFLSDEQSLLEVLPKTVIHSQSTKNHENEIQRVGSEHVQLRKTIDDKDGRWTN